MRERDEKERDGERDGEREMEREMERERWRERDGVRERERDGEIVTARESTKRSVHVDVCAAAAVHVCGGLWKPTRRPPVKSHRLLPLL